MTQVEKASWSDSLRALFGVGMFAAVGARRHEDWRLDALDVMQLKTDDPRGWPRMIMAPGGGQYGTGLTNPFVAVMPADYNSAFPVSRKGAEQLMVSLMGDWFQVEEIPEIAAREHQLMSHAGVVLERFGRDALYFTNMSAARDNPHADMFHREGSCEGFTEHVMDCGVIAVSAEEVGIFWGFTID
ncbi:hypothetical protein ACFWU3_15895 [Streptomyces sp. NPDC058685]|uniref:hypothetical protein n=1 Tax=Streptomyces sp. NPDC058685 TaxID=3346598 RepID=UPI00365588EB